MRPRFLFKRLLAGHQLDFARPPRLVEPRLTRARQSTSILAHQHSQPPALAPVTLTVSIVTYQPDLVLLERCLVSLATALDIARDEGILRDANVVLVDNTGSRATAEAVAGCICMSPRASARDIASLRNRLSWRITASIQSCGNCASLEA